MNKLLQRQIQKFWGTKEIPKELQPLLQVINDSYTHFEKDRKMLERSIELSSSEMVELNNKLRIETTELKKAHKEIGILFENIDAVYYSIDMIEKRVIQMSATCEKIYGYTRDEFIGNMNLWKEVIHPEDLYIITGQDDLLREGKSVTNVFRIIRKDKTIRWVETKIIPTLYPNGLLARIDGITSDVTELKKAEEKLGQKNRELLKINAELDRFVYSASHELRAPLASVLGLINLIRLDEDDQNKLRKLDMMQTSVERLDLFIRDIIAYSRNSRLKVDNEIIDFKQIIRECVQQLHYMPEMKKIKIVVRVEGNKHFISDKKRIEVIMNNFLSNAIKYHNIHKKDPFIHIYIKVDEEKAEIEISDNGIGIHASHLDQIFNMFFRATETKTGSGLGLFIVKEIIDKLQGTIRVSSIQGKGTSFFVTIPQKTESVGRRKKMMSGTKNFIPKSAA